MKVSSVDSSLPRSPNLAVGPLPLIPRRSASRRPPPLFTSPSPVAVAGPVKINVQGVNSGEKPAASSFKAVPDASLSGSSSEGSSSNPRLKRGVPRASLYQPPSPTISLSRVTSSHRHSSSLSGDIYATDLSASSLQDTPRASVYTLADKRLSLDDSKRIASESHLPDTEASSKSAPINSTPPMIVRNKSGQPIKSSLKSTKTRPRGNLSVITGMFSSKSEPNTPSLSKAVHFDTQLEHVKLFLAEQKPLAVSRDGSPTDDTSGTDSDFPPFIFGEPYSSKQRLVMNVVNMPPMVDYRADVAMDSLLLSADGLSIIGRVRARNLAFQKWLAVRFTFDAWHTTSEVTARYVESANPSVDIFSFSIRLNDIMAWIEERTLVLALRYSVEGREMWDNNNGRNYVAKFSWVKDSSSDSGSDIADLKKKLENVMQKREDEEPASLPPLPPPRSGPVELDSSSDFKKDSSLSSRYDFGTSLKTKWSPPTIRRSLTQTYPTASATSPPSSIPWPTMVDNAQRNLSLPVGSKPLGSPRDQEDGDNFRPAPCVASDTEDSPSFATPTKTRNHHRGYFDLSFLRESAVKRTPPGTPRMRSVDDSTTIASRSPGRCYSFPPVDALRPAPLFSMGSGLSFEPRDVELGAGSDESTPSIMSPIWSSSSSATPSPTETEFTSPLTIRDNVTPRDPDTDYNHFLNRFCFYTGPNSTVDVDSGALPGSSSMSSVDDVLTVSVRPRVPVLEAQRDMDTCTQPQDDNALSSGSSTPMPFSFHGPPRSFARI